MAGAFMEILGNNELGLFLFLVFSVPGFAFLKGCGYKAKTDYEWVIMSLLAGIFCLIPLNLVISEESFNRSTRYPYLGAVGFVLFTYVFGLVARWVKSVWSRTPKSDLFNDMAKVIKYLRDKD